MYVQLESFGNCNVTFDRRNDRLPKRLSSKFDDVHFGDMASIILVCLKFEDSAHSFGTTRYKSTDN